jgi:hypothetical protein
LVETAAPRQPSPSTQGFVSSVGSTAINVVNKTSRIGALKKGKLSQHLRGGDRFYEGQWNPEILKRLIQVNRALIP